MLGNTRVTKDNFVIKDNFTLRMFETIPVLFITSRGYPLRGNHQCVRFL